MGDSASRTSSQYDALDAAPANASVRSYLGAIRRHPVLVACVTAAALLGSLAWLGLRSHEYRATASILAMPVSPYGTDDTTLAGLQLLRDSGDPAVTMQTAAALVRTGAAAQLAASGLGHGWTANRVLSAVSVQPEAGSSLVDVTAIASSPSSAVLVANTFARASLAARTNALHRQIDAMLGKLTAQLGALPSRDQRTDGVTARINALQSQRQLPDPTLSIAQTASASQAGPSPKLVIPLVMLVGLLLGCVAAVVFEVASGTVEDDEDLRSVVQLPVIARLAWAASARRRTDHVPWSIVREEPEAVRGLLAAVESMGGARPVVMVTSPGTDDGKTTTSITLALGAAAAARRVTLMEFELSAPSIASRLPLARDGRVNGFSGSHRHPSASAPGPTAPSWLEPFHPPQADNDLDLQDLISPVAEVPSLSVLASNVLARNGIASDHPALARIASLDHAARRFPALVRQARDFSNLVLIDAPGLDASADALRLLPEIDALLLVVRLGHTRRVALRQALDRLERVGKLPVGIVVIERRFAARRTGSGSLAAAPKAHFDVSRQAESLPLELTRDGPR
jgi:Mrp family chromosome partitioning ATPase/capsular polysaccharide biosynthesis protein